MAHVAHPRPLAGSLAALRRTGEIGLLGVAPVLLALAVIVGAIGNRYAFDFHGALWQSARDVLDGRNPYPPATHAGIAPGDRFVYPPPVAILLIPLGALPFPIAAAIVTVILIAAVAATLAVLGVRDWRCYGAAYLSIAVLHDIRLGALTPLLALGLALAWRWRAQARAAIPLALIVVAKLFLWPLGVWLVATGRFRVAWRARGARRRRERAGLGDHRLRRTRRLPRSCCACSPTPSRAAATRSSRPGSRSASSPGAARAVAVAVGAGLIALCWREGRRGFDERSLALALAAALAFSPIVWLHYFVLLLVPIALARRTFGAIWLIPALFWITPFEENFGADWRIAAGIAIAALALGRCARVRRVRTDAPIRSGAMTRSWNPASPAGGGLDIPYSPAAVSDGYVHVAGVISSDASGEIIADDFASQAQAHVRQPRDDARGGRLQRGRRRPRHDLPHRPRRFRRVQRGLQGDVLGAVSRARDDPRAARRARPLDRGHGRRRAPALSSAQVVAAVRRGEVERGADGHDEHRVDVRVRAVVVPLDVVHVDGRGDAGVLVELAQVARQVAGSRRCAAGCTGSGPT